MHAGGCGLVEVTFRVFSLDSNLRYRIIVQTDGKTVLRAEDNFSFSALPYSAETLTDCAHDWELPKSDGTYLSLDFFMSGIGSNSCGPVLDEKWEAPKKGKGSITLIIK